jgi:murein DD-endopeptidase / murein LD-carboxypeptidase
MKPVFTSVSNKGFSKNRIILIFLLALGLTVTSCSKRQLPTSSPVIISDPEMLAFLNSGTQNKLNTGRAKPNRIISTAEKFLGTPHCMGGATARCMDCSGLTYTSFQAHKIAMPRRSQDQARYGRIIFNHSDLKRGDLVFFTKSYSTSDYITHVGIYLGSGQFLHASTSSGVIITPMSNPWWSQRFVFGTRVFNR